MSLIPIDEVVHFTCVFHDTSVSPVAVADATGTPTFEVFEEATDTPIITATNLTKRTSLTGRYRGTFTASAANGFEAGKWYNVDVSGTCGGASDVFTAMRFRCGPAEAAPGVPLVDVVSVLAAIAALNNLSSANILTQVNAALDTTLSATIPADGTRPTLRQGVYMSTQFLLERTVAGLVVTVKNPDTSTLMTLSLNDATTPSSVTRAT